MDGIVRDGTWCGADECNGELGAGRRRRRWPEARKAAIVAESFVAGAKVLEVAARHEVNATMLSAWRGQTVAHGKAARIARKEAAFVPVTVIAGSGREADALPDVRPPAGAIEIVLADASIRTVGGAAGRAGEAAARREVDRDVEPLCRGVEVAAGDRPRRRQAQRQLQQVGVAHRRASALARPARGWRRARPRQARCAPLRGGLRPCLTAAARGARGVVRPGRRNGPLQPNQETPPTGRRGSARQGAIVTTHSKQRGGVLSIPSDGYVCLLSFEYIFSAASIV